jgi:outer membrane protein TolC
MKRIIKFIIFSLVTISVANAQHKVFTLDSFIRLVKTNHPVAKQSELIVEKADASLRTAKGEFDPSFSLEAANKTYDGKNYYNYTNPELKIPTPFALSIKTGMENNSGEYINSEVTKGKSSYLGIEVPLLQGLLLDKKRAALQQAKIFQQLSRQQQLQMINDLLYDAYTSYLQWVGAFIFYNVITRQLKVAEQRFNLVKLSYASGDKSVMDTLDAFTQLQNFQIMQSDAYMMSKDAALNLSVFLWNDNGETLTLPDSVVPDTTGFQYIDTLPTADEIVQKGFARNPELLSYNYKTDILNVERRLKFQSMLPTLDASANLLNSGYNVFKQWQPMMLQNNNKWALSFKLPLFLREARGEYKLAQIKIRENNYALMQKRWEVENKIRSYRNQYEQLQKQLRVMENNYKNYDLLLKQEELRSRNGESSLFILNSRESKLIEVTQKLIELEIKYRKAYYAVQWSAGLLVANE